MRFWPLTLTLAVVSAAWTAAVSTHAPQAPAGAPPQRQQTEIELVISGAPGAPPKYAVPDFIDLSRDAETAAAARTIGEVLWQDLSFEREFYLIPRDTYASIPRTTSPSDVAFDRWRELGADALVTGTVQRVAAGFKVEVRLYNVRARQSVFAKEFTGPATNPRLFAHTISDDIHLQQRGLRGVARTRLTFSSDRDGERITGTVFERDVKEIYLADYDGANQRRITVNRTLNITPTWSPDGRAIAYTSYLRGFPVITISRPFEGRREEPAGTGMQSWLPAWSPDGTQIAFSSNRDGNVELYVLARENGAVRRVTNHPMIDVTPTWSPTGTQLAFTSDRSGSPQVYLVGADGLNLRRISSDGYCDRPTWSPAPFNEIAFVCRTGGGFDIKVYDIASGATRQITFGQGSNESPSYSPNGRHLAFTSTRGGRTQVYTIGRDGRDLRQITKDGNNFTPDWSR